MDFPDDSCDCIGCRNARGEQIPTNVPDIMVRNFFLGEGFLPPVEGIERCTQSIESLPTLQDVIDEALDNRQFAVVEQLSKHLC